MTARKNKHGVYEDHDGCRLIDARARIPLAEVRVAETEDGWRAAACFAFTSGNWWGQSGPITDRTPPFPSRSEAIAHAAERLHQKVSTAPSHVMRGVVGRATQEDNRLAGGAHEARRGRACADGDVRMRRPLWQIILLVPLWLIYVPARAYVSFMDRKL